MLPHRPAMSEQPNIAARSSPCVRSAARAGFAMPLVMMVSLIAGLAIIVLLSRISDTQLATKRQLDNYAMHHNQAGIKEFLDWWSAAYKTPPNTGDQNTVLGFDMVLADGAKLSVRLYDAQGTLRRRTTAEDRGPALILNRAADDLVRRGLTSGQYIRDRGPGKVSLASASEEVLSAVARAVSPQADGSSFARGVIEKRRQGKLTVADLRPLSVASQLQDAERHHLEACLETDSQFWRIEAMSIDTLGNIVTRQGGYAIGRIGSTAGNRSWAIVSWGALDELPPRFDID